MNITTATDQDLINDYRRYYQDRPSTNREVEKARKAMQEELMERGYRISEL